MNITKEKDKRIPKGDGCFNCPYYTFDDRGYNTYCWKYKTRITSDGFRGIKMYKCDKKTNKKKKKN